MSAPADLCACGHALAAHQTGEGSWTGFCGVWECVCEAPTDMHDGTRMQPAPRLVYVRFASGSGDDFLMAADGGGILAMGGDPVVSAEDVTPGGDQGARNAPPTVYVATLETRYAVVGVGATEADAKAAAVAEYVRTNNSGYGLLLGPEGPCDTVARFEDYAGIRVYGPLALPGAATEG